jgi:CRISPR-associated RAMP protein (TIGR02581 family)
MLKKLVNEARFTLTITTEGPVLVRSGHATLVGPDMTPVRTFRNGDWQVYLPGSSLKGVFRSHLEKICRTLKSNPVVVCNPFWMLKDKAQYNNGQLVCPDYLEISCGDKFERRSKEKFEKDNRHWAHAKEDITSEMAYSQACPICRLFGSTEFIGRVNINDAYLVNDSDNNRTEERDGVGIDRLSGGSFGGALFNLQVVASKVEFKTEIHLRNFEVWQLGMLLVMVQDMADGLVRVGSGKSRGLGKITGKVDEVVIYHLGALSSKKPEEVWGLGKFLGDGTYGTQPNDSLALAHAPQEDVGLIRRKTLFTKDSLTDLTEQATRAFISRLQNWSVPTEMQFNHLQFSQG